MKRLLAALLVSVAAPVAQAEIFDLSIGDNAFRATVAGPLARLFDNANGQYDVGLLLKPETDEDLLQIHTGVLLTGDAGARDVDVAAGLGIRAVYTGIDSNSGGALALGGQLEGRLPSYNRIGLTGYAYYAPEVLTVGDVANYIEYGVALDYEVIRGGAIYVGYRNIEQDFDLREGFQAEIDVDSSAHVGFRLKF
jgi:hypothetical protein